MEIKKLPKIRYLRSKLRSIFANFFASRNRQFLIRIFDDAASCGVLNPKILIKIKKSKIPVNAREARGIRKYLGLMFRSRNTENLLFSFLPSENAAIHSLFVFFPFLAAWLDDSDRVVDISVVKPFTLFVQPRFPSAKLLEIPFNVKNRRILARLRRESESLNRT